MFEARVRSPVEGQTAVPVVMKSMILASNRVNLSSFTDGQAEPQKTLVPPIWRGLSRCTSMVGGGYRRRTGHSF